MHRKFREIDGGAHRKFTTRIHRNLRYDASQLFVKSTPGPITNGFEMSKNRVFILVISSEVCDGDAAISKPLL